MFSNNYHYISYVGPTQSLLSLETLQKILGSGFRDYITLFPEERVVP